jgi:hypothetical protein
MRKVLLMLAVMAAIAPMSRAATAVPVAISGISVSGNTLTVTTSAAHGLSATLPSGFCISGSSVTADNVCGVVLTAPSGTTYTFTLAGGATCAASCGTVAPAKRVIWLQTYTVGGGFQVNYLLWLTTTAGVPGKTSAWSGASTAENNALQSGAFIEVQRPSFFFPLGASLAQAEALLSLDWTAQENLQTGSGVAPGSFFGNFNDGVGWLQ